MAIFGDLGKAIGLGTAKQTMAGALQGALRGAIMGQPFMGGVSGAMGGARTEQGQSTGVSIPDRPAAETSTSGSTDAQNLILNVGTGSGNGITPASMIAPPLIPRNRNVQQAGVPAIIGGGVAVSRGMLGAFLSGAATGIAAPTIIDPFTGQEKKLRVTRRLRSQVKKAVEMFGVDQVANQMGVDVEVIFFILTKRIRNDGPAITKAALRKTRSTMRKLDAMCDMRDKMRPPARRASRARTTSKVMQIKN